MVGAAMMACSTVTGSALNTTGVQQARLGTGGRSAHSRPGHVRICAVKAPEECNEEDCAPAKEVGKLSMEWKAEENTKVTGTYPPVARSERKWTGYVEKDTAGQTNIYAVEPTVYVAESAISTGNAGGSAGGSNESLAVAVGLALVAVVSASSILFYLGKNAPAATESTYSGPPLSYYVAKFSATDPAAQALESPPLADDLSIAQPQVAVQSETLAGVSSAVEEVAE